MSSSFKKSSSLFIDGVSSRLQLVFILYLDSVVIILAIVLTFIGLYLFLRESLAAINPNAITRPRIPRNTSKNNISLNNLAPLYNEDFKSYYNLKKVSINNDSNIIYYSPLLINVYDYYNFPLIFLEKCQIELSEKNQKISELIIALNISQNNIMNYTFHLLGKEKEIYLNNNCVYIKQFPLDFFGVFYPGHLLY